MLANDYAPDGMPENLDIISASSSDPRVNVAIVDGPSGELLSVSVADDFFPIEGEGHYIERLEVADFSVPDQ